MSFFQFFKNNFSLDVFFERKNFVSVFKINRKANLEFYNADF